MCHNFGQVERFKSFFCYIKALLSYENFSGQHLNLCYTAPRSNRSNQSKIE